MTLIFVSVLHINRSEGFPERDIWSLGVMDQGSCQIGRVLGTSPPLSPEVQVDILAKELYLQFSNWILTHMRALRILTPGFYTEFRVGSISQSDLAWGAILEKCGFRIYFQK